MIYTLRTGDSYAYKMGHFPAPWGNEIRVGVLETVSLTVFLLVILFSFLGGMRRSEKEIEPTKYNIYCILTDLTMLSLIALVYTNDLFTAYVFIEINTLAAAGLVMMRQHGRALVAGVRYMMMNLLGSSLFLIGIVILYTITGHLLMVNIHESVVALAASGQYHVPLTVVVSLISVGLAMKCALFPFDKWLPAAYSNSTPSGSAMLSSIVSKGYIFLLIKVYVRVIGFDVIRSLGICDVLFVFGAIGMIAGSVNAMRAKTTRMMVAYSSVAQIGYIFAALGLGNELGILCALWHTLAHSATKSMLFISAHTLDHASGDTHLRKDLRGGFYRSPLAAAAFTLGAANLVGVPDAERLHHQGDDGAGGGDDGRAAHGDRPVRAGRFHTAQRLLLPGHDDAAVYPGSRTSGAQRPREDQRLRGDRPCRLYRAQPHTQLLRAGHFRALCLMA